MAYALQPEPNDGSPTPQSSDDVDDVGGGYVVSSEPLIAEQVPLGDAIGNVPQSYGAESLHLLPSDPWTLFVFWDIDWRAAFGSQTPSERKVHLRILDSGGTEEGIREIEPLAGTCTVTVSGGGVAYSAEIGCFDNAGSWNVIATSAPVRMPPDGSSVSAPSTEYATIPFHLTFQRMLDSAPTPAQAGQSLTSILSELRGHGASNEPARDFTLAQREVIHAIESVAKPPPAAFPAAVSTRQWSREKLQQVLGLSGTSPTSGFGGSSWAR